MTSKRAIIIGAGPAGLTAAYELLKHTDIQPIVLEKSDMMGGISRTVNYKGNRIDIGGHRFFSKSDRVMQWWLDILPMESVSENHFAISYQNKQKEIEGGQGPDPEKVDEVMLVRSRKSRIYFLRKFFDYPLSLSVNTLTNMGFFRTLKVGVSYLLSRLFPIRNEKNLEEFFINRFGRELYKTFFKSYTEKVWGSACSEISAEWGAQRIKGLSISKAIAHAVKKIFNFSTKGISQKNVETSLIERFLYPKYGPGQMWEEVARQIESQGGRVLTGRNVEKLTFEDGKVSSVECLNGDQREEYSGDYFFSTMPVKELVGSFDIRVPDNIKEVSGGLIYRDFLTVGLLLKELKVTEKGGSLIQDNWIYIQEPDVLVGRLQIFNNWSPYMASDQNKVWVGLEYFCNEGDSLWSRSDDELKTLGAEELDKIDIIEKAHVLDATVVRMPKAYPAYFGTYDRFQEVRDYLDSIENLFLVGRNGMHRYNNQDHSMLAAMTAVENIVTQRKDKSNIWDVNTEQEYHEEKDN